MDAKSSKYAHAITGVARAREGEKEEEEEEDAQHEAVVCSTWVTLLPDSDISFHVKNKTL